jgi:hypothetical protein
MAGTKGWRAFGVAVVVAIAVVAGTVAGWALYRVAELEDRIETLESDLRSETSSIRDDLVGFMELTTAIQQAQPDYVTLQDVQQALTSGRLSVPSDSISRPIFCFAGDFATWGFLDGLDCFRE